MDSVDFCIQVEGYLFFITAAVSVSGLTGIKWDPAQILWKIFGSTGEKCGIYAVKKKNPSKKFIF